MRRATSPDNSLCVSRTRCKLSANLGSGSALLRTVLANTARRKARLLARRRSILLALAFLQIFQQKFVYQRRIIRGLCSGCMHFANQTSGIRPFLELLAKN